ncbi:MAG: sulfite exporter TauE/SafE family protein [Actinomycetota bacterium]|jgi:uncharacterized membrane protein YfcA|nr:sulfite exporter TauE/SafE family protein [Actinomycetota bacterium]
MSIWAAAAVTAAGLAAGFANVIVGAGSLITFPTLVALGYPPVLANMSNTVGLVPGSVSGAVAYRRELAGQARRVVLLSSATLAGGVTGGALLLVLPPGVFQAAVPVLIAGAAALMAVQPRVSDLLARRGRSGGGHGGPLLAGGVVLTGIYGGYFGAAQGVILLALLATFLADDLQRLNATKNVLAAMANLVSGLLFVVAGHVDWTLAGLIAAGSVVGGQVGATVGRRLPPRVLRGVVVVGGTGVAVLLAVRWW